MTKGISSLERHVLEIAEANQQELFLLLSLLVQRKSEIYTLPDGTLSGHEANCQALVCDLYREAGLKPDQYSPMNIPGFSEHEAFLPGRHLEQRPNVSAVLHGTAPRQRITLMAHVDTVPAGDLSQWRESPYSGTIRNGYIYGRGAADDKSGIAAGLYAIKILKKCGVHLQDDIVLTSYCDEEQGGGNGALATCLRYPSNVYINLDGNEYQLIDTSHAGGGWQIHVRNKHGREKMTVLDAVSLITAKLRTLIPFWQASFIPYPQFQGFGPPEMPLYINHVAIGDEGDTLGGEGRISFYVRAMQSKAELVADLQGIMHELEPELDKLNIEAVLKPFSRYFPACLPPKISPSAQLFLHVVEDICQVSPNHTLHNNWSDLNIIAAYGGGDAFMFNTTTNIYKTHGAHMSNEAISCQQLFDLSKIILSFLIRFCKSE